MSRFTKTALALALSAATVAMVPSPASALVVASGFRVANFTFVAPTAIVPINGAALAVPFFVPAPTRVVITFSAECAVDAVAGVNDAWIDIDIRIDGAVIVPPTGGTLEAFCTANGTAGFDGYTHPSITVVANVAAGAHNVSILARRNNGATGGWIGDSSIVLER